VEILEHGHGVETSERIKYMNIEQIFVVAPTTYTGGPTALHQLCYHINKLTNSSICKIAYNINSNNPIQIAKEYEKYKVPWTTINRVPDSNNTLIIVPEIWPYLIKKFTKSKKAIYWLSVDNFILSVIRESKLKTLLGNLKYCIVYKDLELIVDVAIKVLSRKPYKVKSLNDAKYYTIVREFYIIKHLFNIIKDVDLHITQSFYSKEFLTKFFGISLSKIVHVREPIEEDFLKPRIGKKINLVAFNTRKAFSIVYKIIKKLNKVKDKLIIVQLENVGKQKMIDILSKSKVFVDIGIHPGRDRPAREAGALYNIVIANRRGGYFYPEDLPLPEEYMIKCKDITCRDINIDYVVNLILDSVHNYDHHIKKFKEFIEYIYSEPSLYLEDLKALITFLERL